MDRLIVLLTDFGYKDPYVGVVKGVIKSINPNADIIDLTHEVSRQDVYEAALLLFVSYKYFPHSTIFVSVVDPGVGSTRKALLVKTRNYYFIGPDNGSLYPASVDDGIMEVYDVSNSPFKLKNTSYTFHGRDLFAPIAAHLSLGLSPSQLGYRIDEEDMVKLEFPRPQLTDGGIKGSIIYIDVFGNIMTNIDRSLLEEIKVNYGSKLSIELGGKTFTCRLVPSFSYVGRGEVACYINSWGFFEIGINHGNAARALSVKNGDPIVLAKK